MSSAVKQAQLLDLTSQAAAGRAQPGTTTMKAIAATVFLAALAGCANHESDPAQVAIRDDAQCQSYGAKPGSDVYVQCRVALANQQGQANEARRQRALQMLMNQQGQKPQQPYMLQPAPVRQQTNCVFNSVGQTVHTNCQ
jgi:hypothetical protein